MRAYNIAPTINPAVTATGPDVNLMSSLVKPGVFLQAISQNVSATHASPAVFTGTVALPNGTPVQLSGDAVPGGFTAGQTYYVVATSSLTFELAATKGGSAINSTDTGTNVSAQALVNAGAGGSTAYDEEGTQGYQVTPGNTVVVAINSAADHAGTTISLQGADPSADPTVPGSYADLCAVAGISTSVKLFSVVLKQFLRWKVVADASEGSANAAITILS